MCQVFKINEVRTRYPQKDYKAKDKDNILESRKIDVKRQSEQDGDRWTI